jgi:glycosyltransferase involved in cell wall biosynthesis
MNKSNILVNALGIRDSGGLATLKKTLNELKSEIHNDYYIFTFEGKYLSNLLANYINVSHLHFLTIKDKGIIYRICYENFYFPFFCKNNHIVLIYNLTGSSQFFSKILSIVKVQNLLFFSKKLDLAYIDHNKWWLWIRQVWLKRLVFSFMLRNSKHIEIQSEHVKEELSKFININNKNFYVKSDIHVEPIEKLITRQYNFQESVTFLFITGPHFYLPHKNIVDFVKSMVRLLELGMDYRINITLSYEQLNKSGLWNNQLNNVTSFLGYLDETKKIQSLYTDNSILVSTSVIETLGLHVIDAILNDIVCIVPDENYSEFVYGVDIPTYKLYDDNSLTMEILKLTSCNNHECQSIISSCQSHIFESEKRKIKSSVSLFTQIVGGV